jgi:hypothetical protein
VKTCHPCQIRSTLKLHIPLQISTPTSIFTKVYIDVMHMPMAGGYKYIVIARDGLSGSSEGHALTVASSKTISKFIFEELICRYGSIRDIVTDNGTEFKGVTEELLSKYQVNHIRISPYNSQANGPVERGHFTIREALIKSCGNKLSDWPKLLPHALFADRITARRATGYSPYFLLYGTDPVLPLDLFECTYLVSGFDSRISTEELLTLRIRQLRKLPADIAKAAEKLKKTQLQSKDQFEKKFGCRLITEDMQPGTLVLVRNTAIEKELDRKSKPRYFGPLEVHRKTKGGSYILKELDGTIIKTGFAAYRLLPYYARAGKPIEPEELPLSSEEVEEVESSGEDMME